MELWFFLAGLSATGVSAVAVLAGLVLELRRVGEPERERAERLRIGALACHAVGLGLLPLAAALLFTLYAMLR